MRYGLYQLEKDPLHCVSLMVRMVPRTRDENQNSDGAACSNRPPHLEETPQVKPFSSSSLHRVLRRVEAARRRRLARPRPRELHRGHVGVAAAGRGRGRRRRSEVIAFSLNLDVALEDQRDLFKKQKTNPFKWE